MDITKFYFGEYKGGELVSVGKFLGKDEACYVIQFYKRSNRYRNINWDRDKIKIVPKELILHPINSIEFNLYESIEDIKNCI